MVKATYMERILLLINPQVPDGPAASFACHIARLTDAVLTGIFVSELFEKNVADPGLIPFVPAGFPLTQPLARTAPRDMDASITMFRSTCGQMQVPCETLIENFLTDVVASSAYFDLFILDPLTNFPDVQEELPTGPAKMILHEAQCPVLVAPEVFKGIGGIIFCYDGSTSAAQAIRQFAYLFPQLNNRPVTLLEISPGKTATYGAAHNEMTAWLRAHYDVVDYAVLNGTARDELFIYLFKQKGRIAVMGAYGRSLISEFFHHSVASPVLRATDLPLFIYHK